MPVMTRGDAQIHYELHGTGYPVLMLAPGGMRSRIQRWHDKQPAWLTPEAGLVGRFQLIAMDQRNAGKSRAPITGEEDWDTYRDDQLALLDHLGIGRCHVMGGCIGGGPFALALCAAAPDRFTAAVLQNPMGVHNNRVELAETFEIWAQEMRQRPDVNPAHLLMIYSRMRGNGDFVFTAPRSFVAGCTAPLLILGGEDKHHPREISQEIADLAPEAELIWGWGQPANHASTIQRVNDFLLRYTPKT